MEVRTERMIAYCITGILFVLGVICYTALAKMAPEEPIRIFFTSIGGSVLFDHKGHASDSGYAIACAECHHELEEEKGKPSACGECHQKDDAQDAPKKADALHKLCKGCHEEGGQGPVNCKSCHML
ncbi:MAG: hypothetical protein QG552_1692 [Thermodesulfobacteriota bacterium]|nr:hypothetical protein [Thermodesulfobacteriota bacterium]